MRIMASSKVICRLCNSWVRLDTVDYHVAGVCPEAFKKCSICKKYVKRMYLTQHREECIILQKQSLVPKQSCSNEDSSVTCTYCCHNFKMSEIGIHSRKQCPERMTTCCGCGVELRKKVMKKHFEKCPGWMHSFPSYEKRIN